MITNFPRGTKTQGQVTINNAHSRVSGEVELYRVWPESVGSIGAGADSVRG